jgi:hypothetical protein
MNETQQQAKAAAVTRRHWTYRVLRTLAYFGAAAVFWFWVIFLALSGRI